MYREQSKSFNPILNKRWQDRDQQIHDAKISQARSMLADYNQSPKGIVNIDVDRQYHYRSSNRKKQLMDEGNFFKIKQSDRQSNRDRKSKSTSV